MSREFQPIKRVEGQKFAPPITPEEKTPFRSAFWDDLSEDLQNPKFAAEYSKATEEIRKEQQ